MRRPNELAFYPDATQRYAVQRRAFKIALTLGTNSRSKMPPISRRNARPLQRLVRPQMRT
jgi:hypothetical protein